MPSPTLAALAGFEQKVVVGVGDLAVSNNPAMELATFSLGSCLGVTIYDPVRRVGGLLHIMLPDSSINPAKASNQPGMFVDTGVPALFRAAYQMGADKYRIQICLVGGAQVMDNTGFFNIGKRNYESLMALLDQHSLKVQVREVGGLVSRTVYLNVGTGEVRLKTSGRTEAQVLWRASRT
jgi:chemotaxis protein CheD